MLVRCQRAFSDRWLAPLVAVVAILALAAVACSSPAPTRRKSEPGERAPSSPPSTSGSPIVTVIGGVRTIKQEVVLPPWLKPYPFTTPTPEPVPTDIDGTYIRILTFHQTGGVLLGIPRRCLRCIPFKIDAGVSTLVLHQGAYYVNHQLSGFQSIGNYDVSGQKVSFFNDGNCPTTRGVYRWSVEGRTLTFDEVNDPCPFGTERADDLTSFAWIQVDACIYRIHNLWPAALGCA